MQRILVCGGREYCDWGSVSTKLDFTANRAEGWVTIIQGGAKGADFLAKAWAIWRNFPQVEFTADWKAHGKRAGHIRNQQMIDEGKPDLVIAFPGGRGTKDMIDRAIIAGLQVEIVD